MDTINRDALLQDGRVFGDFWFNESTAHTFMLLVLFAQQNELQEVNWPNKAREWVTIPIAQAVEMCKQIIVTLQAVYQGIE